jgi:hypothetical protein
VSLQAFIHQRQGMLYTSFVRALGGLLGQYIDDHTLCAWRDDHSLAGVSTLLYVLLLVKGAGGHYFFSQAKSQWVGTPVFRTLGMNCDRSARAFTIPADKLAEFTAIGQSLLHALITTGTMPWLLVRYLRVPHLGLHPEPSLTHHTSSWCCIVL